MKKILYLVFTIIFISTNVSAQTKKFPKIKDYSKYEAGDVVFKKSYYKNKYFKQYDKKVDAEYFSLVVPENRTKTDSRLISIPVLKIKSISKNPLEPVFLLYGGPGYSNIGTWRKAYLYLRENHDIVIVGYRGIDGYVKLDSEEIPEALDADSFPLSSDNLKKLGNACFETHKRYKKEGIDIEGYNVIEVVDDIETARKALGYKKINLYGSSFGTRIAYLMGVKYNKITIDPDKVKMMMFGFLYTRNGISMVFDAFVAAEKGDYSGIAALSIMYEMLPEDNMLWGEMIYKGISADYDYDRDYEKDMDPESSVIGSPLSKLFGFMKYKQWPMKQIPEEYRKLQKSEVQTLMINGTIDISTPIVQARELLTYLPNGHLVELKNRGHQDLGYLQNEVYKNLLITYYKTGEIDDSGFKDFPLDFSPSETPLQKLGKMFYRLKRLGLFKLTAKIMQ